MSIWAPKPDVFVNMHVYMLVDKGLRVGFRECCGTSQHACLCLLLPEPGSEMDSWDAASLNA